MISEGRYTYSEERELREEEGEKGESAPPPCTTGQMHRCGAPLVMKAGEPDPHTCPGLALARRARTGEKGLSQRTQRRELTHATTKRKEGKPHTQYYT